MAFEVHRNAREQDCVRRERVLAGAGQLLCRGCHEQQGGPAEPEPDAAGASSHAVTRACGRGGLQAVDVRGGRRGD